MKLSTIALASALGMVMLAGCTTAATNNSAAAPATTQTVTPTPTPTPEAMTVEAAADYYLDTVCPANAASAAWNANTASGQFEAYKVNAQPLADAYAAAAARFDDPSVLWPEVIDLADITTLSDTYYGDISVLQGLANATSEAEAAFTFASRDASATASQKVRARLGLGADTTASCADR